MQEHWNCSIEIKHSHVGMPMYNLTEYSKNYSKAFWILFKYYRDKPNSKMRNF